MRLEYSLETCLISVAIIAIFALVATTLRRRIELNEVPHQYRAINGMRGLAAVFVFINHAPFVLTNLGITNATFSSWGQIYPNLGSFGVQIFFCITGFLFFDKVMRSEIIDWTDFFIARIRRVAPLYYLVSAFVFVIALIVAQGAIFDRDSMITLAGMMSFNFVDNPLKIGSVSLVPLSSVTWTLVHEWRFYAILPVIAISYRSRFFWHVMLAVLFMLVCDLYYSAIVCWGYFYTGMIAAYIFRRGPVPFWLRSICLLLSVVSFVLTLGLVEVPGYGAIRYILASTFFISFIIASPALSGARWLNRLSDISYSIYLVHLPILFVVYKTLGTVLDLSAIGKMTFWLINFGCIVPVVYVSTLTFVHVERRFMKQASRREGSLTAN